MIGLRAIVGAVRTGRDLRHLPIVLEAGKAPEVRMVLRTRSGTTIDVTRDHVPVSMRPLVLGVRLDAGVARLDRATLEIHHPLQPAGPIAAIELRGVATEAHDAPRFDRRGDGVAGARGAVASAHSRGALHLFRTVGCRNHTAPPAARWLRYALAWRHARLAPRRGDGLCMSAADLRCLNAYYIAARPVYLVAVAHAGRNNFFPMDLVGPLSSGEFLLALRATSPAIALMEGSRQVALSGAPADARATVYALGAHHRKETVDVSTLPFATVPSPCFGLPSVDGGLVREIEIGNVHRNGSHVLFVGGIVHESGETPRQLGHVSAMFAEWLARRGCAVAPAT